MKRFTLVLMAISAIALLSACGGPTKSLQTNDSRECARNFTYDGSFLSGRTYKTNAFVANVSQDEAMKRAARHISNDGWNITNTDTNLGIISAAQTVSYGQGKTVPLNVSIAPVQGGVKVNISYSTSGGVTSPVDAVSRSFCEIIEAIDGK